MATRDSLQSEQTLDIDLGNSALKYRLGERSGRLEYGAEDEVKLPELEGVARVRVSSVLTSARDESLAEGVRRRWGCGCEFARSRAEAAGVTNGYRVPETLGVDRWLAAVAGYHHAQGAVMVVDLGTAATLDFVDPGGNHLGGFIVPGTALMRRSLLSETAAVRFDDSVPLDDLRPGQETRDAVERGVFLALLQLIEGELERFHELCHHNSRLVMCGGGAESIARHLKCSHEVKPDLVLDGLALVLP